MRIVQSTNVGYILNKGICTLIKSKLLKQFNRHQNIKNLDIKMFNI